MKLPAICYQCNGNGNIYIREDFVAGLVQCDLCKGNRYIMVDIDVLNTENVTS